MLSVCLPVRPQAPYWGRRGRSLVDVADWSLTARAYETKIEYKLQGATGSSVLRSFCHPVREVAV